MLLVDLRKLRREVQADLSLHRLRGQEGYGLMVV